MKKIVKLLGIFLMLISLTGCIKNELEMTIGADKNVSYREVAVLNKTLLVEQMEIDEAAFDVSSILDPTSYKDEGFKVEDYSYKDSEGNEWVGYIISKQLGNIDSMLLDKPTVIDLSGEGDVLPSKMFSKDGEIYKGQFSYNFEMDDDMMGDDSFNFGDLSSSELDNYFNITYQVTLPYAAISNDADEVSNGGKTLKWQLRYGKLSTINYQFSFNSALAGPEDGGNTLGHNPVDPEEPTQDPTEDPDDKKEESDDKKDKDDKEDKEKNNMVLYIAIGGGALLLVGVIVVIVIVSKKKKNNANNMNMGQPMQQSYAPNMMQQPGVNPQPVEPNMMNQPVVSPQPVEPQAVQQPVDPNNNQQPPVQ